MFAFSNINLHKTEWHSGGGEEKGARAQFFQSDACSKKGDLLGARRGGGACSDFVFSRNKKTLEVVIFEHSIMFHFH